MTRRPISTPYTPPGDIQHLRREVLRLKYENANLRLKAEADEREHRRRIRVFAGLLFRAAVPLETTVLAVPLPPELLAAIEAEYRDKARSTDE